MKHPLYLVLPLFFLVPAGAQACSCSGPSTFCQTVTPPLVNEAPVFIFAGQPLGVRWVPIHENYSVPVLDVVVLSTLVGSGAAVGDTLALIGQDGLNCAVSLEQIDTTQQQVFGLFGTFTAPGAEADFRYPHQELTGCGVAFLELRAGVLYGPVAPGVDSLALTDFVNDEAYCIAGRPEECNCITQEQDFCVGVSDLDRAGFDLRIVQLRRFDFAPPATFTEDGFPTTVAYAEITATLHGSDFAVGDTVLIEARNEWECRVPTFSENELLWAYTSVDYAGVSIGTFTTFPIAYPLLREEPCVQRFAEIVDGAVQTLAGPVPYDDYLVDLAECLPTLSADGPTDGMAVTTYPNPAGDWLTVGWGGVVVRKLDVLDARGRTVARRSVADSDREVRLDTAGLPTGLYYLRLRTDRGSAVRRVVVR